MGLLRRQRSDDIRIFFATDIHGSEVCFKKFVAARRFYEADVLILGGDMTGKMIIPLSETTPGHFSATVAGRPVEVAGEEIDHLEAKIRDSGFYPYRTDPEELAQLAKEPDEVDRIFHREMVATLYRWGEILDDKLAGSEDVVYVAPGNDDPLFVDDILRETPRFQLVEDRVVSLPGEVEMASTGYSNVTPWRTHREVSEEDLREKLDKLAAQLVAPERAIFNVHVPPYASGLDEGPDIDPETLDQNTSMGRSLSRSVGSTAVRDVILERQPALSLHGHIHESRGAVQLGRTLAINPGSDYGDSILRGCIVQLRDGQPRNHQLTSG